MIKAAEAMKLAWKMYRDETRSSRCKYAADRAKHFARCLKAAWSSVKETARRAALSVADRAREEIARIDHAIEMLYYRPFGMSISRDVDELKLERGKFEAILAAA